MAWLRGLLSVFLLLTVSLSLSGMAMPSLGAGQQEKPYPGYRRPGEAPNRPAVDQGLGRSEYNLDLRMPGVVTTRNDDYICSPFKIPEGDLYITKYMALASVDVVHHLLLYACEKPLQRIGEFGPCSSICKRSQAGPAKILYAWAKNAQETNLPKDVSYHIGGSTGIKYFVIQIHYKNIFSDPDHSGVRLAVQTRPERYKAGLMLSASNTLDIPPNTPKIHANISCVYRGSRDLHPFAFRVHAHQLGTVISSYLYNGTWAEIGKGNPNWPQAFYKSKERITIKPQDTVVSQCTFNSTGRNRKTYVGATNNDEMCNFYMMYYTEQDGENYVTCSGDHRHGITVQLPADSDVPLPPNPDMVEEAMGHHHHDHSVMGGGHGDDDIQVEVPMEPDTEGVKVVPDWPKIKEGDNLILGQVAGVATCSKGNVHIFHRGNREWDQYSFNAKNEFAKESEGPIKANTVVTLSPYGKVIEQWGSDMFYMPHGMHIDDKGNLWLTDVAMHQVFRIPAGSQTPDLVLGEKMVPGNDSDHFCKPADVATLSTGEFYVADGYCNARIMKFSADGKLMKHWGKYSSSTGPDSSPPPGTFVIPHSLTVLEKKNEICVADRENGRIQCFDLDGEFLRQIHDPRFNTKVYAVTYSPANEVMYAINGPNPTDTTKMVQGFTIGPKMGQIFQTWKPSDMGFSRPHDVAVGPAGRALYVTEIGPNKIWKFSIDRTKLPSALMKQSEKKAGYSHPGSVDDQEGDYADEEIEKEAEGATVGIYASFIILAVLVIPILVIVIIATIMRLRKGGRSPQYSKVITLNDDDFDDEDDFE